VADDFDVNFPGVSPAHPLKTHWDSFSTSLQLSSGAVGFHNSTIRRDTTSAEFDASSTLQAGHVTNESAFNLRASLHDADVETMQALVGYHYPITGNGDLLLQASGTVAHFQADGQIHVADVTAYGEAIPQFDSSVHYVDGELAFDNVHLFYDDSIVAGSAAYNPATRAYRLDLRGNNFDLAHIRQVQASRLQVDGQADFAIRSSGTADAPSISGTVQIHNLALDHEPAGDLQLEATTENHELRFTGTSHLQRGSIAIGGNVQLRDDYVADLSFHFEQLDLDALWHSYVGEELTGHSAVGGAVSVHGPIRHPLRWAVDGDLSALAIEVEQVQLHNQDPIRFTLANRALEIQQLHMVGEGTDLAAHGSVQLSGDRRLDLEAEGHADLKLISGFDSDIAATGLVTLNMTIGGSVSDPRPQGRVEFSNGTLAYTNIPSGLSDLNGSLSFTRDHFQINSLTAHTGGGTLDFKGDASYLDGQFNFSVSASGKDVRLRYPPGVSSTANADLRWTGTKSNSTVSGEIVVNKIAVTPGFDFSSYLQRGRTGSGVIVGASPLNNVKLDIRVETSPELQMRTAIARLSGDADLRLRGSVARPAVLGRVDVLEGQATFHGTRFTLERGDITFANPVSIEPQLNLQASTHVRNYDLNITVTGTPDRGLNINYRSEPPLPKSDIIALLALGRTGDESTQLQEQSGQSAFSDQATALILSQALNTTVSSRLERIFGASNIKIDPQGLTTETNPTGRGPQVSIEQEFANNISLTYSTNVSQNSQQIIEGEYYINRNLSILGTRDQNGVVSFDLQIRQRKK
jgi:translocation and assembly module TamB